MKILIYYKDGFMRKFALDKPRLTIGRGEENDLRIDEPFVSRRHLEIEVLDAHVLIRDLKSTNGTFLDGLPIETVRLKLGDSFSFKGLDFFLQEGHPEEFAPAKELLPLLEEIRKRNKNKIDQIETRNIKKTFTELLTYLLYEGMKNKNLHSLLSHIAPVLEGYNDFGSMLIITRKGEQNDILFSVRKHKCIMGLYRKAITIPNLLDSPQRPILLPDETEFPLFVYPFTLGTLPAAILYFPNKAKPELSEETDGFLNVLAKELDLLGQMTQVLNATQEVQGPRGSKDIVSKEPAMQNLIRQARKIAPSKIYVLIEGESGTGKELFARLIHLHSKNNKKEFVAINCAAIPEQLLESELFGYERGAFTGANVQKKGKLELASGGTLVLDEIGEMPLSLQAKLLRALEENAFYRLGGLKPIQVDLRIISLTNTSLLQLIAEKRFREDLYYRLVHHTISIPPLRQRPADIPTLIEHFTLHFCRELSLQIRGYSIRAFDALQHFTWPGNVRQLRNEINRLINLAEEGETIGFDILSDNIKTAATVSSLPSSEKATPTGPREKERIIELLCQHQGSRIKTARALGISYQALWKKMKKAGLGKKASDPGRPEDSALDLF